MITTVYLSEAQSNMKEFDLAGFPECVGSCDCTHIVSECCEYNIKNNHLGAKNALTTRTFNLTRNHIGVYCIQQTEVLDDGTINLW